MGCVGWLALVNVIVSGIIVSEVLWDDDLPCWELRLRFGAMLREKRSGSCLFGLKVELKVKLSYAL